MAKVLSSLAGLIRDDVLLRASSIIRRCAMVHRKWWDGRRGWLSPSRVAVMAVANCVEICHHICCF